MTDGQRITLWDILCERGASINDLDRHYRVLKQRRDAAFRLTRLAALQLSTGDRETIRSLRKRNTAWRYGRMKCLSEGQFGLLRALEAKYLKQRQEATQDLIQCLVEDFELESNRRDPIDAR